MLHRYDNVFYFFPRSNLDFSIGTQKWMSSKCASNPTGVDQFTWQHLAGFRSGIADDDAAIASASTIHSGGNFGALLYDVPGDRTVRGSKFIEDLVRDDICFLFVDFIS